MTPPDADKRPLLHQAWVRQMTQVPWERLVDARFCKTAPYVALAWPTGRNHVMYATFQFVRDRYELVRDLGGACPLNRWEASDLRDDGHLYHAGERL